MSEGKNHSLFDVNYDVDLSVAESSILAVLLCIIIILDIAGNATMVAVVLRNKRMWTETNMFMMNLVFGDMAVSLLSMPLPLITVIRREWIFKRGPLCSLNAYCNSLFFVATIFTHTTISIDRYLACVKPMHKVITRKKAVFMIAGVWLLAALISLCPLLGWGHMDYNATALQCGFGFPRNKFETSYILLLAVIAFIIPICVMTFAYIRIYFVVRNTSRRMSVTTFGQQRQRNIELQKKIVLTFFLALIAFIVCWSPFFAYIAVAANSATRQNIPRGLGIAAYWCGFLNSACNPFIIGLRNEQFKEAFQLFFCWPKNLCKRHKSKENEHFSSQNVLSPSGKNGSKTSSFGSLGADKTEVISGSMSLSNIIIRNDACDGKQFARKRFDSLDIRQTDEEEDDENRRAGQKIRKTGRQEDDIKYDVFLHQIGDKLWRESGV